MCRLSEHKILLNALARCDLPILHRLLRTAVQGGASPAETCHRIEQACSGDYSVKGYTVSLCVNV